MNAPVVLMLTDGLTLDDTRILAVGSSDAPTIFSSTVYSSANPTPQGIVGTEAQLVRLRDVLDQAIDRARSIERQHRLVSLAPEALAEQILADAHAQLAEALQLDPALPFVEILGHLKEHSA